MNREWKSTKRIILRFAAYSFAKHVHLFLISKFFLSSSSSFFFAGAVGVKGRALARGGVVIFLNFLIMYHNNLMARFTSTGNHYKKFNIDN